MYKINLDEVPSTIEEAARAVAGSATESEREMILSTTDTGSRVHHGLGRWLRNGWSLWAPDSPLKRDAVQRYGIAHADDISSLIADWAPIALVRGEAFDPDAHCLKYHEHWARFGKTSLQAGGWPPKESENEDH